MKQSIVVTLCSLLFAPMLFSQSGSINNTLGSGGTFTVKNSSSAPLVVVDETTGQLTADRVKVEGVPSFFVTHVEQTGLSVSPTTLATWSDSSSVATHDNSDSFDASTGVFTVPRDGFYFLSAYIEFSGIGALGASLHVKSNSDFTQLRSTHPAPSVSGSISIAGILKLQAGALVTVALFMPGVTSATAGSGYFSGYLVSDF